MTLEQALSLRKQLMVEKIMVRTTALRREYRSIKTQYKGGTNLQQISRSLDLPPVAIFRMLLDERVRATFPDLLDRDKKLLVKLALRGEGEAYETLMSKRDRKELAAAKEADQSSYSNDPMEREKSIKWEQALCDYLDAAAVSYATEDEVKAFGYKSTPDVVVLDDLYINGQRVRWIDSKNYYGSAYSKHFAKKMVEQSERYDLVFMGSGALIYRLGFSQKLATALPHCLLLDHGPLDVSYLEANDIAYS